MDQIPVDIVINPILFLKAVPSSSIQLFGTKQNEELQMTKPASDPVPRLALTADEAAESTGLTRTRIFAAIRDKKITARKDGKSTVIEISEIERWIKTLPTRGRVPSPQEPDLDEKYTALLFQMKVSLEIIGALVFHDQNLINAGRSKPFIELDLARNFLKVLDTNPYPYSEDAVKWVDHHMNNRKAMQ
jgi:excisionase family DNA binding protein